MAFVAYINNLLSKFPQNEIRKSGHVPNLAPAHEETSDGLNHAVFII